MSNNFDLRRLSDRRTRWAAVLAVGTALTAVCASLAAWNTAPDDRRLLTFVVFAVVTAPVFFGGAWALLPGDGAADPVANAEDTVEHSWYLRATSGAFTDLVTAMGLALAAEHVLGAPSVPLVLLVVLAVADAVVRYVVLSRREA